MKMRWIRRLNHIFFSSLLFICHAKHIWANTRLICAYLHLFTLISNQLNLLRLSHLWKSCIIFLIPSTDAINISLFWPMRYKIIVIFIICFFEQFFVLFLLFIYYSFCASFIFHSFLVTAIEFNILKQCLP